MAVIEGGISQTLTGVGAQASSAMHVSLKPNDAPHYRFSMVTGTLAAGLAAGAVVFAARWVLATPVVVLSNFRLRFLPLTPFTAATLTDHTSFDAFTATSFTGSFTGGTALTLTGTALKVRQSMIATQFADIRIATTAALTPGTATATAHPFAQSIRKGNRVNPAAATEEVVMPQADGLNLDYAAQAGEYPIVLGQTGAGEGILVKNRTVWPAAGTGILLVEMAWSEPTSY